MLRSIHERARVRSALLLVVALTATCGCATAGRTSLSDRFVTQGEPSIDLGGPEVKPDVAGYASQLRALAVEARPRPKDSASEVAESADPFLRERIETLKKAPSAAAHRAVALEYRRLGILDAAFQHLSTAIRLDPMDATAFDLRARIWRAWELPRLGLPDARRAVGLAPKSPTAWNTLGLLLEESGQGEPGTQSYLRAVAVDAGAGYAWTNLCRVWIREGDARSAVQACRHVVRLDPSSRKARANLARAEALKNPTLPGPPMPPVNAAEATAAAGDPRVKSSVPPPPAPRPLQ